MVGELQASENKRSACLAALRRITKFAAKHAGLAVSEIEQGEEEPVDTTGENPEEE